MFKFVVWASCGLVATAMAVTPGRPNYLEGGHTYFYSTTAANTPANADNIFGRQPQKLENYAPTLGRTNMIFMARSDTFSISTDYQFRGIVSYTGSIITSQGTSSNLLEWNTPVDGVMTFKISDSTDVRNSGGGAGVATTYTGGGPVNLYFTHANSDAKTLVQVCCINRSDAYYRVPINDIYYVPTGASLWFRSLDNQLGSPWEAGVSGKWSWTRDAKFDKFTISAAAGETVHLRSQDGVRDLTVHVIDPATFHFESRLVYFRGTETRTLSSILWEKNLSCTTADVAQVTSATPAEVSVAPLANGDWKLQAHGHYDLAREVTLTRANGDVVLLKIVSTPGRFEDAMCASTLPPTLLTTCTSLLVDDAGTAVQEPEWEESSSTNAPPGYTNVMQTLNCVRFNGRRYSAFVACKTPDFTTKFYNNEAIPAGQLRVVKTLLKVVCWLEDENGDLFVNPKVCFGGIAFGDRNPTRFSLGVPGRIYTDDSGLKCEAYLGATLSALNLSQGVAPDEYGYYTVMVCCQGGIRDELAVFSLSNCHKLEVRKELQGADDGSRYLFEATYTDLDDTVVTKRFSLANGEKQSFAVKDGGIARVREVAPSDYVASLRVDETGDFAYASSHEIATMTADHIVEFRNQRVVDFDPVGFWFTDHEDAGPGFVNLAFQPTFAYENLDVAQWLRQQQEKNGIRLAVATSQTELRTATGQPVAFRGGTGMQDIDKGWVWITAPVPTAAPATTNVGFFTQLTVDKQMVGYNAYLDNIIGTSADSNSVSRTDVAGVAAGDSGKTIYSFSNPSETEQVMVKRKSRVKSVLLVGGGGAGGGGTGGGGGGGEVKLIDGAEFGFLNEGDVFHVKVGRGGAPAGTVWGNSHGTYPNGVSNFPGSDGGASVLEIGGKTFSALGGGGGGSSHSTYEGVTTPIGLGRPGANGGGSAGYGGVSPVSPTGGVARAANGHVGGGASNTSSGNGGAGGGGGMGAQGVSGTASASGDGGAGVAVDLPGMGSQIYGAGGGGGANSAVSAGLGGVNAGNGGGYVYSTAAATPGGVGSDAVAGFGGGGGGGGRWGSVAWNQYLEYRGGRGGDGRVVVVLQDASVIDADCTAEQITLDSAQLKATVLSDALRRGLDISYACVPHGETLPALTPVQNDVKEGSGVTVAVTNLARGTTYDYVFKFVNDVGQEMTQSDSFTTKSITFPIGYEDDNMIVSANVMTNDPQRSTGDYVLVANRACTNGHVLLKRELVFVKGLVVGGGGAGGVMVGGGGGGGGVTNVTDIFKLPAGTELLVEVGAGGLALKKASKEFNDPGDPSSLTIGEHLYTALGGGVGASRYTAAGGNGVAGGTGANGGGGVGETGAGGTSSEDSGFAGGKGANRWNSGTASIAGGGGGAGEKGADGVKGTSNTTNFAGKGGEGVVSDFIGTNVVYGSGGGGGADQYVQPGAGGTNGGAGGAYQHDGEPGVDGTGGGGGGCGYSASPSTTLAGRGGCGAVMFQLQRPVNGMVAAARVNVTSPFTAAPAVTVAMLDAGMSGVAVDFAYVAKGGTFPAWTRIAENVQEGTTVPVPLTNLAHTWTYEYKFRIVGSQGERIVAGEFTTPSLAFATCFEDDNLIVSAEIGVNSLLCTNGTEYCIFAGGCYTNVRMIVKNSLILNNAVIVGGGGAGGSTIGGGGGGGGVLDIVSDVKQQSALALAAGTELVFSTGAGGRALGTGTSQRNENGTNTTLRIGNEVYTVAGGGAGASRDTLNGWSGGNGGGASSSTGTGGAATTVGGHVGGVGGVRQGATTLTGGGGGAGEDGGMPYTITASAFHAGNGGEGRSFTLAGQTIVVGSGGGGGSDNSATTPGTGGTHAGAGGAYNQVGAAAEPGYGGGGGGGAAGGKLGGNGGSGAVLLRLMKSEKGIGATAKVNGVGPFAAEPALTVSILEDGVTEVAVDFACAAQGETLPAWTRLADQVPVGGQVTTNLTALAHSTTYRYRFRVTGSLGERIIAGTFTTPGLGFAVGYEDGNLIVSEDVMETSPRQPTGEYVLVASNACSNAKVILMRAMTLYGGDIEGIASVTVNGAAFDLSRMATLPAGTELVFTVGAGSATLNLAPAEAQLAAAMVVKDVSPVSGRTILNVATLDGNAATRATVSVALARGNDAYGDWTTVTSELAAGASVTNVFTRLSSDTDYRVKYRVAIEGGAERVVEGCFHTTSLGFEVLYEDDNLIVPAAIGANGLLTHANGEYGIYAGGCYTNVRVIVKSDLVLNLGLVVGGGGAGGPTIGGGGGGGGVLDVVADVEGRLGLPLAAGTELVFTTGAGGRSLGQNQSTRNENGQDSTLTIGATTYTAEGGGAGGGQNVNSGNGFAGGNGGGAAKSPGVGGAATTPGGFAGGAGGVHGSAVTSTGGGGGAAAPGGNARTLGNVFAAGNGGEGRLVRVGGQTFVFGSGGGGGSDGTTTAGTGGTHAGSGGASGKPGGAGDAGFGGGGGGAGNSWQLGGAGGSGAVLFQFFTPAAFTTLTNQPPQVVISEVMASNGETIASGDGTEGLDWVELRNDSPYAVDLTDWKLSDETGEDGSGGEKLKGARMLPAFGTIIVWADKDKAKAKDFLESETYVKLGLSTDGEDLSLIAPGGTVVSTLSFGKQVKDYSYGRDAQGNLGHYRVPTPGAYNTGTMYGPVTPRVQFSVPHGYQRGPISVALTCAQANGREIRYTTDGSSPTTNSTLYTAPIAISRTTCLRAAVMEPNSVLQDDTSATYLYLDDIVTSSTATPANFPASGSVNSHTMMYGMPNLPAAGSEDETRLYRGFTNGIATLSFVIDPKDLFDSKTGIYVNCSLLYKGDEWERKVMVEQIDPRDATNEFAEPAGLRLRGASSSRVSGNPKHSFHLYFRSRYGAGSLKFPLFGEEGADEFDTVDLRTDQNYSWSMPSLQGSGAQCTFIHEVFARDTQRDMGTYYTRSRYYHLYINGQYWGLYQTQERGNSSFAKTYNGGKKANYDVIKTTNLSGSYVVEADSGDWNAWSNLCYIACSQGFSGAYSNNYEKVRGLNPDGTRNPDYPVLVNLENLMTYVMNSHYMCDGDSPVSAWLGFPNNMYCLRDREDGDDQKRAGFFFLRHDAEHAMGGPNCTHYRKSYGTYTKDPTGWGTGSNFTSLKQFNPFELHYTLCSHPEYKVAFADAFYRHCLRTGGALTVEKASERFRKRMTELDDAIVCEAARWARSGAANGQTRANWLTYCGYGFEFITNRLSYMTAQYRGKGWYPQTDAPVITDTNDGALTDGQELAYGAQAKITVSGAGTVAYYTLDGTDPRAVGGAIAANAMAVPANGLVTLPTGRVTLRVRARSSGGEWSALAWVEVLVASANNQLVVENLRVAEVMSAPAGDKDVGEYIVLTNLSAEAALDLEGVRMRCYKPKKSDDVDITFPAGTQIAAGGSLRLEQAMWWAASKLKNKDIEIKLVNAVGNEVQTAGVNAETWFASFDPPHPCDGLGYAFRALEFGASVTTEAQWTPVVCP